MLPKGMLSCRKTKKNYRKTKTGDGPTAPTRRTFGCLIEGIRCFSRKAHKMERYLLQGGLENLKDKPTSPINTENQMLKQMIGEKSMEIELLYQKVEKLEAGLPPKHKRSRKFQK